MVVLDYGSGNLRSAQRALERVGAQVCVTADPAAAEQADGLVIPGVGAFASCMAGLLAVGGDRIVARRLAEDRPILAICVGMQVLFELGLEHGERTVGLGVLPGRVERLEAPRLPHMGWNTVQPGGGSTLFAGVRGERFYFVHSYGVHRSPALESAAAVSTTCHGETFVAAVEAGVLSATQFHPEKSGAAGARLLSNWVATL